ncbi:MAG TPA: hypothetical protein VF538_02380 [Pyrinomonadaceae bacterium]|jgi:hypothetical protein
MKLLKLSSLVLMLCVAATAGGEGRSRGGVEVRQGRERKVEGADLRIALLSVGEDSRCPVGATCVWAGNAKVRLSARNSKGECAEFELNTNLQPAAYDFGGYTLALADLSPRPSTKGVMKPRGYTATVTVTKNK